MAPHTPGPESRPKTGLLPSSQSVSAISTLTLSDELRAKVDRMTSGGGLKRSFDDHVKMNKIAEVNTSGGSCDDQVKKAEVKSNVGNDGKRTEVKDISGGDMENKMEDDGVPGNSGGSGSAVQETSSQN